MVDVVNSVNGVGGSNAAGFRAAAQAPAVDVAAPVAVDSKAVTTAKNAGPAPISPRLTFDPTSGAMVTEFTNSDGQVTAQVPSTAALAYLRAGLNAQGLRNQDPQAQQATQAATDHPAAAIA